MNSIKIQNRRITIIMAIIAIFSFTIGFAIQQYIANAEEDTAPVWICAIMGNQECGEGAPVIDVRW